MKGKVFGLAVLVAVVSLMAVVPVWGGGWAVVTLDALPTDVRAGESFDIGFTVRQHGRTPLSGLETRVLATHARSGDHVTVEARGQGSIGHYVAALRLPLAGEWDWSIDAFEGVHPMPTLSVGGSRPAVSAPTLPPVSSIAAAGLSALLGLAFVLRRRLALAAGTVAVSMALAGAGTMAAEAPVAEVVDVEPAAQAEVGAQLFVAKGCVTCHINSNIVLEDLRSSEVGPNLSVYSREAGFLREWLAHPSAVRAGTEMPDLNLRPQEIEALIAFLNAD